jgi:uncharacterized protein YidB (DUF937 family)
MGLMDILNGMQNGPRGMPQPSGRGGKNEGGMSPLMMALLGLLAYKAMKHMTGGSSTASAGAGTGGKSVPLPPQGAPTGGQGGGLGDILGGGQVGRPQGGAPGGSVGGGLGDILGSILGGRPGGARPGAAPTGAPSSSGGLDDLLRTGLGGLLGGAAAGTVLQGGLNELLKGFQQSGNSQVAQSWVGKGANDEISAGDLEGALGGETLDTLAQHTGMERDELLSGLAQQLPHFIDQLTPNGRPPTAEEWSRMV